MMPKGTLGLSGGVALLLLSGLAVGVVATSSLDTTDSIRSQSLLFETFDSDDWETRWKHSRDIKYNGKFAIEAAKGWNNKGLQIPDQSRYYGLAALPNAPVEPIIAASPEALPLVIQYEIKYSAGVSCGGAYIKLLTADASLVPEGLTDATPYSIKFGPDSCGENAKVNVVLCHRNPANGIITEHHLASPPVPGSSDLTHIYTLRIFPDHRFEVLIDGGIKSTGYFTALDTLSPPLVSPQMISDAEDVKPADWVEEATISDPNAVKPQDWDDRVQVEDESAVMPEGWLENEPEFIDDPAAQRPADWNEEANGAWTAAQIPNPKCNVGCGPWNRPLVANPACKGEWKAPTIPNPEYKGTWAPRQIPNPLSFTGVGAIGGVAFNVWTGDAGYTFDNLLITRQLEAAEAALKELWKPRREAEEAAVQAQIQATEAPEKEPEVAEAPGATVTEPAATETAMIAQKETVAVVDEKQTETKEAETKEACIAKDGDKQLKQPQEGRSLAAAAPVDTPVSDTTVEKPGVPVAALAAIPVALVVLPLMVWSIVRMSKKLAAKKKQAKAAKLANGDAKPANGEVEAKPANGDVEEKTVSGEAETNPAIEGAETKPTIEEAETKPAIEGAETKPAAETKPTVEEAETKPAIEEAETKPTIETKPAIEEPEEKTANGGIETKPASVDIETEPANGKVAEKTADEEAETKPANGDADLSVANGHTEVKAASGDAELKEANGASDLKHANGCVELKHENGDAELKEAIVDVEAVITKAVKKEAEEPAAAPAVKNAVAA